MKLVTYKSIAFLLKFSAENYFSNHTEGGTVINVNKNLSLLKTVTLMCRQKSIDFSILKKGFSNFKNKFSNYILVGKDKSVIINCNMKDPTSDILQQFCYD